MRRKEDYVPNVDLTLEFSTHKSAKGKTDFNGKTTRKETKSEDKEKYPQEVIDIYGLSTLFWTISMRTF